MDKQRVFITFLITIVSSSLVLGGAWALTSYKTNESQKDIKTVSMKTDQLVLEVSTIRTENKERDKKDVSHDEFQKFMMEWMIADAEWKGKMTAISESNIFYGRIDDVNDLKSLSDKNKKSVSKKKHE